MAQPKRWVKAEIAAGSLPVVLMEHDAIGWLLVVAAGVSVTSLYTPQHQSRTLGRGIDES